MTRALGVILPSITLFVATTLGAYPVLAQLDAGSRIRVTTARHARVGTLVSLDNDSLRYTPSKDTAVTAIPVASVLRLERSAGKRPATGRGAKIGALAGGGFGLFLGIAASTDNSGWWEVGAEDIAAATAFVGVVGAGIGALIGAASKQDRWEPVPLSPGVAR